MSPQPASPVIAEDQPTTLTVAEIINKGRAPYPDYTTVFILTAAMLPTLRPGYYFHPDPSGATEDNGGSAVLVSQIPYYGLFYLHAQEVGSIWTPAYFSAYKV